MVAKVAMAASQLVSPLFEEIRASYGEAFDQALQRNVTDALAEDVGDGDRTGLSRARRPCGVRRASSFAKRRCCAACPGSRR